MRLSNTAQALLLLALMGGIALTEAAKERITVKNHGIKFKVDWWDDGRTDPYRVSFTKKNVVSKYTFDAAGRLTLLYVDDDGYIFTMAIQAGIGDMAEVQSMSAPPDRMLISMPEDKEADEMKMDRGRRLYDCPDCEQTWDTICDIGLKDVCYWVGLEIDIFTLKTVTSIELMCKKFTKECTRSATTTCEGICTEGGFHLRGGKTCAKVRLLFSCLLPDTFVCNKV